MGLRVQCNASATGHIPAVTLPGRVHNPRRWTNEARTLRRGLSKFGSPTTSSPESTRKFPRSRRSGSGRPHIGVRFWPHAVLSLVRQAVSAQETPEAVRGRRLTRRNYWQSLHLVVLCETTSAPVWRLSGPKNELGPMRSAGVRSAKQASVPKNQRSGISIVNLELMVDWRRQDARTEERQVTMEMAGSPPGPTERLGPCEPRASL